jgi:hypothetical protein
MKPMQQTLCPPRISHWLVRDRSQALHGEKLVPNSLSQGTACLHEIPKTFMLILHLSSR